MAAPFVTGIAALISSIHNNLAAKDLKEKIICSVNKKRNLKDKVNSGGIVNATKALNLND